MRLKGGGGGRGLHPVVKYPLLPTGIGMQDGQTISNFSQVALLRQCELPLLSKMPN